MAVVPTDAHCHIGGVGADFPAAVCAINPEQWRGLSAADNPEIKKVFGLFLGEALQHSDADIDAVMDELAPYLRDASAVGEFGLDKRFAPVLPFYRQEKIFDAHVRLALETHKPCVLHCVGAWGFLLRKMRIAAKTGVGKFLLHSASCPPDLSRDFAKLGAYFSFSPRTLRSRNGAETAAIAPAEKVLLESDDTPDAQIYAAALAKLADLRNISESEMSEIVEENFHAFYL